METGEVSTWGRAGQTRCKRYAVNGPGLAIQRDLSNKGWAHVRFEANDRSQGESVILNTAKRHSRENPDNDAFEESSNGRGDFKRFRDPAPTQTKDLAI